MKTIYEILEAYDGPLLHKWDNYIDIYDHHFSKYRGKEIFFLEIGISHGGSLKFWREYFGEKAHIYAIDVNPECKQFETERTKIFIGSQEDPVFLEGVKKQVPPLDVLLDDGGHTMKQQIVTFDVMFDHVKENGLYVCEDVHTSYMREYGGGLKRGSTFIEFCKNHIDNLHAWFAPASDRQKLMNKITTDVWSVQFYDSVVVHVKRKMKHPEAIVKGEETVNHGRFTSYGHKKSLSQSIRKLVSKKR